MKRIIISLTFLLYFLNTTTAQYDDPKWEVGAEVGITRLDSLDQSQSRKGKIKQSNSGGVAVRGIVKYNINGQFQFIGGLGIVKAKGEANIKTTYSKKSYSSATVYTLESTNTNEDIIQNFTLLEMPVYLRMHLLRGHREISDKFNIFLDFGGSFKIPLNNKSSISKDVNISTTEISRGWNGWYYYKIYSEPTTTSYTQKGGLELQSKFSGYLALGFLVGDRTSITLSSSRIKIQREGSKSIKYKSNLSSVSVAVFF